MGSYKTFYIKNQLDGESTGIYLKFNRSLRVIGIDGISPDNPNVDFCLNESGSEIEINKKVVKGQTIRLKRKTTLHPYVGQLSEGVAKKAIIDILKVMNWVLQQGRYTITTD